MAFDLGSFLGSNIGDAFQKIVGAFKVPPEQVLAAQTQIEEAKIALQSKLQDAITQEIQSSAEVIKAEAASQSWLPRNVRPLCLLMWALLITFNYALPLLAHFSKYFVTVQPLVLPDWIYKLTAIGFTGYVTARTWEKYTNSDN